MSCCTSLPLYTTQIRPASVYTVCRPTCKYVIQSCTCTRIERDCHTSYKFTVFFHTTVAVLPTGVPLYTTQCVRSHTHRTTVMSFLTKLITLVFPTNTQQHLQACVLLDTARLKYAHVHGLGMLHIHIQYTMEGARQTSDPFSREYRSSTHFSAIVVWN